MGRKSRNEIEAVLATIDNTMETVASAGAVDHSSQMSSWTPPVVAEEQREAEFTAQIVAIATDIDVGDVELPRKMNDLELDELAEQALEVLEASAATVSVEQATPVQEAIATLEALLAAQQNEAVDETVFAIAEQVDGRAAFEEQKAPENANIQRTLKKVRSQMVTKRAARLLLATQVDPAFINRSLHDGSRYNVYALGKLADIVYAVTDGVLSNAINVACLKTLFAFHRAGETFTAEIARAAASNKIRIDARLRPLMSSHTVSASTAPTQASSTMQALQTLGIVKSNGSGRNPVYEVLDGPLTRKLMEKIAA